MSIPKFNSFSRILSYILHPLLIPTIATTAIMFRPDLYTINLPFALKIWFLGYVFVFTIVIPASAIFILQKLNAISSIEQHHRSERTIPLLISSSSYMAMLYLVKSTGVPPIFLYILYSATIALLAGLLINLFYKISLHTLGWAALATTLTGISLSLGVPLLLYITLSVLLAGLTGYIRLKENAHNQTQVYLGYLAGVAVIGLIIFLA